MRQRAVFRPPRCMRELRNGRSQSNAAAHEHASARKRQTLSVQTTYRQIDPNRFSVTYADSQQRRRCVNRM